MNFSPEKLTGSIDNSVFLSTEKKNTLKSAIPALTEYEKEELAELIASEGDEIANIIGNQIEENGQVGVENIEHALGIARKKINEIRESRSREKEEEQMAELEKQLEQ